MHEFIFSKSNVRPVLDVVLQWSVPELFHPAWLRLTYKTIFRGARTSHTDAFERCPARLSTASARRLKWKGVLLMSLGNLTWQRFWMKENYDSNKEIKITRFFPSKIYMCSLSSLIPSLLLFVFIPQKHGFYTPPFFLSLYLQTTSLVYKHKNKLNYLHLPRKSSN